MTEKDRTDAGWAIAEADRIIEERGWSRSTVEDLRQEFIETTDPWGFRSFIIGKARGEDEAMSPPLAAKEDQ